MSETPHTYVIGDVHGYFDTLMMLVKQIPEDARLLFVGDLIDRGPQSAEVVQFVREGGHGCVLGNHEEMMIKAIAFVLDVCKTGGSLNTETLWMANGGIETLLSYGVARIEEGRLKGTIPSKKIVKRIEADVAWMADLPLYLKLEGKHPSGKPVVVTHAGCTDVWHQHDNPDAEAIFRQYALWNRNLPNNESEIINIHGHTPVAFGVEIQLDYINVDTGCYRDKYGYGDLSAYCVERGEVVQVSR